MNKLLIALGLASTVAFVGCAKKEEAPAAPAVEEAAASASAEIDAAADQATATIDAAAASAAATVDAAADNVKEAAASAPAAQ